jgi:hypothetical protein
VKVWNRIIGILETRKARSRSIIKRRLDRIGSTVSHVETVTRTISDKWTTSAGGYHTIRDIWKIGREGDTGGHILTLGPALDFVVPVARGLDLGQLGAVSSASLR